MKLLLDHIFHETNTSEHNDFIMKDLPIILNSDQVRANEFFRMAPSKAMGNDNSTPCNIELTFTEVELPLFSDAEHKYITSDSLPTTHNEELQLA